MVTMDFSVKNGCVKSVGLTHPMAFIILTDCPRSATLISSCLMLRRAVISSRDRLRFFFRKNLTVYEFISANTISPLNTLTCVAEKESKTSLHSVVSGYNTSEGERDATDKNKHLRRIRPRNRPFPPIQILDR